MKEFSGVRVFLEGQGARCFLPGGEHPGVSRFIACECGAWLHVQALCSEADGYLAASFSAANVLWWERLP
jgi:hypothetical protein